MIQLKNICKSYASLEIYKNFNLTFADKEITVVLGESGSGKTTLLNVIAGITEYNGEVIGDFRPCSYAFQTDRLLPHLTVRENLEFICRGADVATALKNTGLWEFRDYYPKSLSGGMSRRASFLRAILFPSKTVLLDEPFINLDIALKYRLMDRLKADIKEKQRTAVTVTHDLKEAAYLADRIVVIRSGEIIYDERNIAAQEETEKILLEILKTD